jgi:RNAse (barnase) inhibitor barstar
MAENKIITLDLTDCKYLGELHERIRVAFDFPEWYGANLDAFWDLLWSDCDADNVLITGVNTMPDELIEYMSKIYLILDRKVDERKNMENSIMI